MRSTSARWLTTASLFLALGLTGCARWGFDSPADGGLDGAMDGGSDGDSDGDCILDSDCPAGQTCDLGRCQPECEHDGDCGQGQVCDQGACVDGGGGEGDPCAEDTDCSPDLVCTDGTCHATCENDADCAPGTCQAGVCRGADTGQACQADAECEPPGTCVEGWCRAPCDHDDDCGADHCEEGLCTDVPLDGCRAMVRLRDDFEDDLLGDGWEQWDSGGAMVGESGGRLALSPSAFGASEAGVRSRRLFDLTASQVTIEVATMVNTDEQVGFVFFLDHPLPSGDRLGFKQWGGTLSGQFRQAGDNTIAFQRPWDPAAHRILRISENAGYAVWSASANGQDFDELHREPVGFPLKDLRLNMQVATLEATNAPGAVRLEQVNGTRLPPSGGGLEVCRAESISDYFDHSNLRALWAYAWEDPGTSYMTGGGSITLTPANSQTGYAGLLTSDTFKLREDSIWVTVVEATSDDPSADTEFGVMRDGRRDVAKISKTGTELRFWSVVQGQQSLLGSLTYDPVTHRHWRLRQANGSLYWETSSDAEIWIEEAQAEPPFDLSEVHIFMQAGTFAPIPAPGQAVFDNFNVPTM